MCDIILLVYDQLAYTKGCVESILSNTGYPYRLLIIDNGSVNVETISYLRELAETHRDLITVYRIEHNIGYVGAVNFGFGKTTQEYVCVISNDTVVYPGWLSELVATANKDPLIGLVNPSWIVPKSCRGSRDKYFKNVVQRQKGMYIETDWARGFCFLVTRQVLDKIGGLDEAFAPAYFDDWDYSIRAIKAGFRCVCSLGAFVWHYKNVTYDRISCNELSRKAGNIFYKRWGAPIRILFLDDQHGRLPIIDYTGFMKELLNGQNRVTFVSTQRNHNLARHTSLDYRHIPKLWFSIYIVLRLLDNLRHHEMKRYNMIICSKNICDFLQLVPILKKSYSKRFYLYNEQYSGLLTEVDALKQKKGRGIL